ncbi:MAG TPA: diguanylate cyclase [Gaiellaceae bacterium]|jgi:diguanylate cyclase (GGDEF)-like protein|nr:diguanylate cyclase [Gaiellaceae bacterium]
MERAAATRVFRPIDVGLLAAAAKAAANAMSVERDPTRAIDDAVATFYDAVVGVMPSVFVLEHGRLWLVSQRGYAVVPDGITIDRGITGRAVRTGRAQLAPDAKADPDYVPALPGVASELAVPLLDGRAVVGLLNVESERALPDGATDALRPLVRALAPLTAALRSRTLDLAALARLFVHFGSLRDPREIAALAAASLPKVLPVEASQIVVWEELGAAEELAAWRSDEASRAPLTSGEIQLTRERTDPSVACQVLDLADGSGRPAGSVVWLPLRANASELGALIGINREAAQVDPALLDTSAVLAAHVATSLDAAFSLQRERLSAVTDPLTGILNRRGLEGRLEGALHGAQERRVPLSLLVIDCDDFKEINDRAGHEFGDALLREIADVLVEAVPEGAEAARLGGDEFVVMLPEAGVDAAAALGGQIRTVLAEGLTDAGFPLRISAGISTYPFDGARPSSLLRAADQALYAAKNAGKDRVASFRDLTLAVPPIPSAEGAASLEGRRHGRSDGAGAILADAISAAKAIEMEETAEGVCSRLCKALVFVVGATGCSASRVVGDYVVDATEHALRDISLGDEAAYRIADFPLTADVLRTGEPRAVSFVDGDVDPAEAFIMRDLGMSALLMLPIRVAGRAWGLVELYEMRHRRFSQDEIAVAEFLVAQAAKRLESTATSDDGRRRPRVYELPPDDGSTKRVPRTR